MSLEFEVKRTAHGGERRAVLRLPHGEVQTPVFMPVGTAATVKAVPQDVLERIGPVVEASAYEAARSAENASARQTIADGSEALSSPRDRKDAGAKQAVGGSGAEIILANTYHLYLRPGHERIRRLGGVHRFMSWPRPMLTDSGGFQVFSLAKLRRITDDGVEFCSHLDGSKHFFTPEHSMAIQIALGADVMMAFDECVETPASWERTKQSMALTHAWAERSRAYWLEHRHEVPWIEAADAQTSHVHKVPATSFAGMHPSLFGIVQGGMYADLRRESAQRLVEMDFPGYAIGGLAVGEPREVTREMIARTLEVLPRDKPRYVMGVGYPDEIEEYARMGVDMMDCVLPTRAGRHGLLFARAVPVDRASDVLRLNIKKQEFAEDQRPIDEGCGCMVCARYTRAYLRHLFASGEPLAATLNSVHNLHFYLETMERVRRDLTAAEVV